MTRRRQWWAATVAGAAALACSPLLTTASAATYPTSTLTIKSSDGNARGTAWITWMSATHATVSMENCDLKADGRGPIFHLYRINVYQLGYTAAYDHQLSGNGACSYFSADVRDSNEIRSFQLHECNGGSRSDEQRCEVGERANPLAG